MLNRPARARMPAARAEAPRGLEAVMHPCRTGALGESRSREPRYSRGLIHGLLVGLLGAACSSAPPYSGWTEDQLYAHAQRAFEEGDLGEARRAFERLVLAFPLFDQLVEAHYYLARTFYQDEQYISAISEFTRIVQIYPDHPRARDSWMGLCRSYAALSPEPGRDQQYTIQAHNTCQNVADDFSGTPVGDSAAVVRLEMRNKLGEKAFGEGQFYFKRNLLESAELVFKQVSTGFPDTDAAPRALFRLIEIYEEWGWDDQREETVTQLLGRYPDSPEARAVAQAAGNDTVPIVVSSTPPRARSPPAWVPRDG